METAAQTRTTPASAPDAVVLSFPVDEAALEQIPYNKRKTKMVRLARSLSSSQQEALVADLCRPRKRVATLSSERTASSQSLSSTVPQQKSKNLDDLSSLLSGEARCEDATASYHLQELGLLVAATVSRKDQILELCRNKSNKVISDKALALAVHSSCITDSDIRDLFNAANEPDKRKIVRMCSRDANREDLTNHFLQEWLKLSDDRRVLSCEILHNVKENTPWLASTLKDVIYRGHVAALSKTSSDDSRKKFAIDEACYKALRRDLFWKRHGDLLLDMIEKDLAESETLLRNSEIFSFYQSFLDISTWVFPDRKANFQRLTTAASFVPWEKLLRLFARHVPFDPINPNARTVWQQIQFEGVVTDKVLEEQLRSLLKIKTWDEANVAYITVKVPSWISSSDTMRNVSPDLLLSILSTEMFDEARGTFRSEYKPFTSILLSTFQGRVEKEIPSALFAGVLSIIKAHFAVLTPVVFYSGTLSEDMYPSRDDFLRAREIDETKKLITQLIQDLLKHRRITTGQQVQLFNECHALAKRMMLRPEDFSSPLMLVAPATMKSLISTYGAFLPPFAESILSSVAAKIKHAAERGKSLDMLEKVFTNVFEKGILGVQKDVETIYVALSRSYPAVFGIIPTEQLSQKILPKLVQFSRSRRFELCSDVASRIADDLLRNTVIPMARRELFGEDALFSDRPGRMTASQRANSGDIAVRASAMESIEPFRQKWLKSIHQIRSQIFDGVLSLDATNSYLQYLEDWAETAALAVTRALEAKRENRYSQRGVSRHPETMPKSEESLRLIASACKDLIDTRRSMFVTEYWRDPKQPRELELISRAFRLWSAASFPTDGNNPIKAEGPTRLDPYVLEPWISLACTLPDDALAPLRPIVCSLFQLRLNGNIQIAPGNVVQAPASNYRKGSAWSKTQPWEDTAKLFTSVFAGMDDTVVRRTAHEVLEHLEKADGDQRPSQSFFKHLESFLDITRPHIRKRLEQDLTRPLFSDRLACILTLLTTTHRSNSLTEFIRTLTRIAKVIENETGENRAVVLGNVLEHFNTVVVPLMLPQAQGSGSSSDRAYALFLNSPPKEEDWPAVLEAADKLPSTLYKLLDDLLDSTDEKHDIEFKKFRNTSDCIFRRALTWACSLHHHHATDPRIAKVQSIWFECAMELQWRLSVFKTGKSQAANTFRVILGLQTTSAVRAFILETGFQCDVPWPKGKAESQAFETEAKNRRRDKAVAIVNLFLSAYRERIGEPPAKGTPLAREPAMEMIRMRELVEMIQGEWVHVPFIADRIADVVSQVSLEETTIDHQNQVLAMVKELAEASVEWGVKCRDARPSWADRILPIESIVREKRKGGGDKPSSSFGRLGKGRNNTAKVDTSSEDAPWVASRYFRFVPRIVPEFWRRAVERFGIHHPAGLATGRALLRMFLRWNFYLADSSKTRSERQTKRCAAALALLDMCPSAVHIKVVQAVLKDFRQDLLDLFVFQRSPEDPILGKFSDIPPEDRDLGTKAPAAKDGDEPKVVKPFRLGGFYGYHKLTAVQGTKLAGLLVRDLSDAGLSTQERTTAASKLTFIPAVGYADFSEMLVDHFARKVAYAEAVRKRKAEGTEITAVPPLPEGLVKRLFQSILSDSNPQALLSLLNPNTMRQSSTKTTIMVAQRAALLLEPAKVIELVRIVLARKGRDGLLIGPLKAFLRILFSLASQSDTVVGRAAIDKVLEVLQTQWDRPELHRDARVVMVSHSLKALSHALSPANEAFAWRVLEDVARNTAFPAPLRALLLSAEPASSPFKAQDLACISPKSKEMKEIVDEATRFGQTIVTQDQGRFLKLLIQTMDTCSALAVTAKATMEECANDHRKRGVANRQATQMQDVAALFLVNLLRWTDKDKAPQGYETVFDVYRKVVQSLPDARTTDENQGRETIVTSIVPKRLGELLSQAFKTTNIIIAEHDPEAPAKVKTILKPLLADLISDVPFSAFNKRRLTAAVVQNLVQALSREGGKTSLYRVGYLLPFRNELSLLKREAELAATITSFVPTVKETTEEDE